METHELARNLYLSGAANSARSVLQSLNQHGLINCTEEVLNSTTAFERGLGQQRETCSCLIAAAMAAGLAKTKPGSEEARRTAAEKICAEVVTKFRERYQTTRCADIIANLSDTTNARRHACADIVEFVTRVTAELLSRQETYYGTLSVSRFIEHLKRLSPAELTVENVTSLMERVEVCHEEIEKCLVFSEDSYARNLFYKNNDFELLIMCWNKNQRSPIHDHDQSFSVEKIYSGQILCTNYQRINPETDEIVEADSVMLKEGDVIAGRRGDIHRIETVGNTRAVSLHLYAPPLKRMRAFVVGNKTAQWMKLNYLYIYHSEVWQSLESCNL
jgi:cysteine dioxygenase